MMLNCSQKTTALWLPLEEGKAMGVNPERKSAVELLRVALTSYQ